MLFSLWGLSPGLPGAPSFLDCFMFHDLTVFLQCQFPLWLKRMIPRYICSEYGPEIAVKMPKCFCRFKTGSFFSFFLFSFSFFYLFFLSFLLFGHRPQGGRSPLISLHMDVHSVCMYICTSIQRRTAGFEPRGYQLYFKTTPVLRRR